jgi:glutamate formiminotransferase
MEAKRYGVSILESELIGLMPMKALLESFAFYLQFPELKEDQILETKIYE